MSRKTYALIAAVLAAIVVPLVIAGSASADTQPPTQGLDAGVATLQNATDSFLDAVNGENRPSGADGTETEFPAPGTYIIEGPLTGLLQNGPFE